MTSKREKKVGMDKIGESCVSKSVAIPHSPTSNCKHTQRTGHGADDKGDGLLPVPSIKPTIYLSPSSCKKNVFKISSAKSKGITGTVDFKDDDFALLCNSYAISLLNDTYNLRESVEILIDTLTLSS